MSQVGGRAHEGGGDKSEYEILAPAETTPKSEIVERAGRHEGRGASQINGIVGPEAV